MQIVTRGVLVKSIWLKMALVSAIENKLPPSPKGYLVTDRFLKGTRRSTRIATGSHALWGDWEPAANRAASVPQQEAWRGPGGTICEPSVLWSVDFSP